LASQVAKRDDNAAREHLERIQIENDVRAQSFSAREKEFETSARERERALADSRDHLLSTLRMLESDRVTLRAREERIAALEATIEDFRQQLARIVTRAVARNRAVAKTEPHPAGRSKKNVVPIRRAHIPKTKRKQSPRRRPKK